MGSKPASPGRDPSRVGGADPKGSARGLLDHSLREVEVGPLVAGAKAAAEPKRRERAATFMMTIELVLLESKEIRDLESNWEEMESS